MADSIDAACTLPAERTDSQRTAPNGRTNVAQVRIRWPLFLAALLACWFSEVAHGDVDFAKDVAPILSRRCLECHNDSESAGELTLTAAASFKKGGATGPVIDLTDLAESNLLTRVLAGEMPPKKQGKSMALPAAEQAILREWVTSGAPWPDGMVLDPFAVSTETRGGRDLWSLQPLANVDVPAPSASSGSKPKSEHNPIDLFIGKELAAAGMSPAPPAEPAALIRRVYIDLTGLPPTAEEVAAFVADSSDAAYVRMVDRLLESPHFGERWGRYWLDLVRYADTSGYERDQEKPYAWKYRDWVIASINQDKPFDRFLTEQLAGDELPDRSEETVIATGFLRLGTWNDEPNDPEEYKYERLEDLVHATSTAFLGLTLKCARCHDHKFDPLPQTDYYRVAAAFWPGPVEPRDRELLGGPNKDELGFDVLGWTDIRREIPPLHAFKKGDPHRPLAVVPPGVPSIIPVLDRPVVDAPPEEKTSRRRLQLARWMTHPDQPLTARVYVNRLWTQHFGAGLVRNPNNFGFKGDRPTHPALLDWLSRRLITEGYHSKPLHRLMVTSNTYRQSAVHPLHNEYAQRDSANRSWWHSQRRRIDAETLRDSMLQSAGQLDLRAGGPGFKPDISAEALEGLSRKSGAWQPSSKPEQRRRSVYMFMQRSLLPPLMTTFDLCDSTEPCGQRDVSIVAPQALALLNSEFAQEQSLAVADRALQAADNALDGAIVSAFRYVLRRDPNSDELQLATAHIQRQTERFTAGASNTTGGETTANSASSNGVSAQRRAVASLCLVLLNSNEFVFVE